jgi:hypothetical protein
MQHWKMLGYSADKRWRQDSFQDDKALGMSLGHANFS